VRDRGADAETKVKTTEQKQKEVMKIETEKKVLDDEKKVEEEAKTDYMKMEKNVRITRPVLPLGSETPPFVAPSTIQRLRSTYLFCKSPWIQDDAST
jgi:hypothetical protein